MASCLQHRWVGQTFEPGRAELSVGAGQLFTELADFGGEFPVSGVGSFQQAQELASEARFKAGTGPLVGRCAARLLNGLPDVGLAVEPGRLTPAARATSSR